MKPINLTEKEAGVVLTQIICRKDDFENMLIEAASKKDISRIKEIMNIQDALQGAIDKFMDAGAVML